MNLPLLKKILLISVFPVIFSSSLLAKSAPTVPPSSKEVALSLYKERQFDKSLPLLIQLVVNNAEDDELRYYLALNYAKKGDAVKSAEAIQPLLDKDPSFYLYKIHFDNDLAPVRGKHEFVALIQSYPVTNGTQAPDSQDVLAQTNKGFFLYRNGIKIPLKEGEEYRFWGGFLDKDKIYYAWTSDALPLSDSGIAIYFRQSKQTMIIDSASQEKIVNFYFALIQQVPFFIAEADGKFYIYSFMEGAKKEIAFFDGRITQFDPAGGMIYYIPVAKNKKGKQNPLTLQLASWLSQ